MSLCIPSTDPIFLRPIHFGSLFHAISLYTAAAWETGTSGGGNLKSWVNFNSIYTPTLARERREKNQWWEKLLLRAFEWQITSHLIFLSIALASNCDIFLLRFFLFNLPQTTFSLLFFSSSSLHRFQLDGCSAQTYISTMANSLVEHKNVKHDDDGAKSERVKLSKAVF